MAVRELQDHPLALAGLVTDGEGKLTRPPSGELELGWLISSTPEARDQAKKLLANTPVIDDDTRYTWFVIEHDVHWLGLEELAKKDWRKALKAWPGGGPSAVHNRATLHFALFRSPDAERPDAHLRECLRLYHHLSEAFPKRSVYRVLQEQLIESLYCWAERSLEEKDIDTVGRYLELLQQTTGIHAVVQFQERLFRDELTAFEVQSALNSKKLLPFQGMAHPAPEVILSKVSSNVRDELLKRAQWMCHALIADTQMSIHIHKLVSQMSELLARSFAKAGDRDSAEEWAAVFLEWSGEAMELSEASINVPIEDAPVAQVSFPCVEVEESEEPEGWGGALFGVSAIPRYAEAGDDREEWVESFRILGFSVFPLRQFAAYRDLDTGKVGRFHRIPLLWFYHLQQGLTILLASFLLLGVLALATRSPKPVASQPRAGVSPSVTGEKAKLVEEILEEVKALAQEESKLRQQDSRTPSEEKRLKQVASDREKLLKKMRELEENP